MRKTNSNTKRPVQRNAFAESLRNHRAVRFDHKTEPRGGSVNESRDLLDEYEGDWE